MVENVERTKFVVSGKVQGVYYRASALEAARRLSLTGWVRNLADGRVEAFACGPAAALAAFETWLREGPRFAYVATVVSEPSADEVPVSFEIR